jgi:hypothetical protein
MTVRPEFQPAALDEALVARLAELAAKIDDAQPGEWEDDLEEFHRLSGTDVPFEHFQGIYGGEEHEDWVRRLLMSQRTSTIPDLTRADLIAVFDKIRSRYSGQCSPAELDFVLAQLEHNLGDPQISDLIFWPGEYFGDGDNTREMTPEEMAEAALARKHERDSKQV